MGKENPNNDRRNDDKHKKGEKNGGSTLGPDTTDNRVVKSSSNTAPQVFPVNPMILQGQRRKDSTYRRVIGNTMIPISQAAHTVPVTADRDESVGYVPRHLMGVMSVAVKGDKEAKHHTLMTIGTQAVTAADHRRKAAVKASNIIEEVDNDLIDDDPTPPPGVRKSTASGVAYGSQMEVDSESSGCCHCGKPTHKVIDCVWSKGGGFVVGCLLCNRKDHFTLTCDRFKELDEAQKYDLIITRRARKPPVRLNEGNPPVIWLGWLGGWLLRNKLLKPPTDDFPWRARYAKYARGAWAKKLHTFEETKDNSVLPPDDSCRSWEDVVAALIEEAEGQSHKGQTASQPHAQAPVPSSGSRQPDAVISRPRQGSRQRPARRKRQAGRQRQGPPQR